MGIKELAQRAAARAIDATGNLASTVVYKSYQSVTTNVSTGIASTVYTSYNVKAVEVDFETRQVDGQVVQPTDKKFLIATNHLPDSLTPTKNDVIVQGGFSWNIQRYPKDPAGALYQFHVRKS